MQLAQQTSVGMADGGDEVNRPLLVRLRSRLRISRGRAGENALSRAEKRLREAFSPEGGALDLACRVLAEELLKSGRHEQAAVVFGAMISVQPDDVRGYLGAANAKLLWGKPAEAAKLWHVVRERFPTAYSADEQRKHAQSLLRAEAFDEAGELFLNLKELRPELPWGRVGLAKVAEHTRAWHQAVRLWQECLDKYADKASPAWTKALERCRTKARGDLLSTPRGESSATSESVKAYFRLMSKAADPRSPTALSLNFRSVLIISYGRSGSTLLQGMLNSIDGVLVRGENANVFYSLFEAYETLSVAARKHRRAQMPNAPWFGIGQVDFKQLMEGFRHVARTIVLSDRNDDEGVACFGFKEVRYHEVGERLTEYLKFLELLFPEPAFLFLTRDLGDVLKSGWWKERDPDEVRRGLSETEDRFAAFAEDRRNCFQLTYQDMVARTDRLRAMFDFLGAPYRPDVLDIVLTTPHSYNPEQEVVRSLFRE